MIVCSCLVWQWETWFLSMMFSCFPWPPGHLHSVLLGDPAPYPLQFILAPTLTCSLHQQKEEKKAEKRVGFRGLKVCSPSHCLFPLPPPPLPPSFHLFIFFKIQHIYYSEVASVLYFSFLGFKHSQSQVLPWFQSIMLEPWSTCLTFSAYQESFWGAIDPESDLELTFFVPGGSNSCL